jgi:biopolymer transport protein ExbD
MIVAVGSDGRYAINQAVLDGVSVEQLTRALAAAAHGDREMVVIISADATATHQSVINVMDAARRAGLVQITFATQQPGADSRP